ncbi:hypothetical protein GIB67_003710 [Kingdonia uniflora]|uniref:Retrotransposon Copia-like N-terminal domain-containing protein n=1 Tax=Kingdonia uniflora TaxID=39325 RepID=A0A7J7M3Y3_9MAGN|nr:hypothetical protein GIB67_003710 [Kingdonia uniflora]
MAATPLKYPYSSNLNIANFVSLKLKSTNYLLWETQVLSLIESQDLLGFITGKTTQPEPEINDDNGEKILNPDLLALVRTDRLVKAWITATISEEALGTVVGITTSNDVWNALANAYSQNSQAREFELLFKLQEKKKDSTPLYVYLTEFKSTCDQLNAIEKPVPDPNKVFWLLSGLGPRYESFSTAMLKPRALNIKSHG